MFVRQCSGSVSPGGEAKHRGLARGARAGVALALVATSLFLTSNRASALIIGADGMSRGTMHRSAAAPSVASVPVAAAPGVPVGRKHRAVLNPPVIPATGIYLGVDANYQKTPSVAVETLAFEHSMGAPVGIASFYVGFLQIPALGQMHELYATGAIPMINMKCGAPDVAIVAGVYDRQFERLALLLRDFTKPVFFRWFWEMNLSKTGRHSYCIGEAGAQGYVAAYQHIWNIFHAEGASNVAFVWCPSDALPSSSSMLFYPGNRYVEWIGADLYDRAPSSRTFGREFSRFYRYWTKEEPSTPQMICETGAVGGGNQRTWLKQIAAALTRKVSMTLDTPFTQVHAVIYVDAVDLNDYILKPGSYGHEQFAALLHQRFFAVHA